MSRHFLPIAIALVASLPSAQNPVDYPLQPVPAGAIRLDDPFWGPRLERNRRVTIPFILDRCEETGRIANFARAGGLEKGGFQGIYFNDSDVYKAIEAAGLILAGAPDPGLEARVEEIIRKIVAAQEPDGYLYTARTLQGPGSTPPGGKERWSDPGGHELYCLGHLYEAAVAHFQATERRTLLEAALKSAGLVCRTFGPGKAQSWPPGHQEIEIGLVKLFRLTGRREFLDQARFFLEARGRRERLYGPYSQDHQPVAEQREAVGHAVRATYMYAAMADVAALAGEKGYLETLAAVWDDVAGRKLYLTGGIGAVGGHEGFGPAFELPNLAAYCETCAAIGLALWSHRLLLLTGESRYGDLLERVLYNGFLSGVGLDGRTFFYTNPLESDGRHGRSPWFGCACCPPNVARLLPQIPAMAYAVRGHELFVNLFLGGEVETAIAGFRIKMRVATRYPWEGVVRLFISVEKDGIPFALKVRIPGWARGEAAPGGLYRFAGAGGGGWRLRLNGEVLPAPLEGGYAVVRREWREGDAVELELPMPVQRVLARQEVADDRGLAALQRGPLVYCVEWPDVEGGQTACLVLPDEEVVAPRFRPDLLGGIVTLEGKALATRWELVGDRRGLAVRPVAVAAIPYFAWANRGPGEMAVWLARSASAARPLPAPTVASRARASASGGDVAALNDQREAKSSGDHSNRFLHWWPRKGTLEWVQYELAEPTKVSAVEVYWFDDTGRGECRLPASWRLLYQEAGEWLPVPDPSGFGCEADRYNRTTFNPVTTTALRLEVQLPARFSAGIHEWRVD